jgi:CRISPR/Cas system CMR subunit Cmr4 (Cas7 group RAMP superfamily)
MPAAEKPPVLQWVTSFYMVRWLNALVARSYPAKLAHKNIIDRKLN